MDTEIDEVLRASLELDQCLVIELMMGKFRTISKC